MSDRSVSFQLLYFGAARERAGQSSEHHTLPAGTTLGQAALDAEARHPALAPLRPYLRLAVNEAFERDLDRPLRDGDVIAFIPPVAGGAPEVALTHEPLDPRVVEDLVAGPDRGAIVTFTGAVRDHTGEHRVERLEYEAYAGMALKVLAALREEVMAQYPGVRLAVHHRLGTLAIGDPAVVIAASAPHRADAFAACARLIDRLKQDVPIFKKEVRGDGSVWVGLGP